MKNWIRWWGLGLFIGLSLIWFLCIDYIIEYSIEAAGSKVVGAQVDVAEARLELFPLMLGIDGLAVTNPERPMENLFSSERISLQLDNGRLFRRQIIIDDAMIEGVRLNAPRKQSGALAGTKQPVEKKQGEGSSQEFDMPGFDLPDPKALIAAEKGKIKAQIDDIKNNIKSLEKQWNDRIEALPNKETVATYKQRWKEIKKKNWLKKISATKSLHSDIKKDLKQIKALNARLKADIKLVKSEVKRAKALPEKEADRILESIGYSGGSRNLVEGLFGGQAKQWLAKITGLFQQTSSVSTETQEQAPQRGAGQWVHFNEVEPHPDFLIKQAKVSGSLDFQGELINYSGNISDITHQPKSWHEAALFSFKGKSKAGANFKANGSIDLRNEAVSNMTVSFNELNLKDLTLSGSTSMPLSLASAMLNGRGEIELKNGQIDLNSKSQFSKTQFSSGSTASDSAPSLSTTKQLLVDTLKGVNKFNLDIGLTGNAENPDLSLKSDLDKILSEALKAQVGNKISAYKESFKADLQKEILPELSSLDSDADFLNKIEQVIASKKADMSSLL